MPPKKFLKKERLTKTKEFNLVYQKGIFCRYQNLKLWAMPNELPFNRVGFLVTKRNACTIVGINRIKRLLKEAYRLNKHSIKTGSDFIIGCQGIVDKKIMCPQIENSLLGLFEKAGHIVDKQESYVR
jgi:ribonuclease P protein component